MKATEIHCTTMLGVGGNLPIQGGNCFSVMTDNGKAYYVVNMRLENFEGLIKQKRMDWPVEVWQLTDDHCMVIDERVPENWYLKIDSYCSACYPVQVQNAETTVQRYSEGLRMANNDSGRQGGTA